MSFLLKIITVKEIYTEIWNHKVFYREFGKKKNQTLLILHGWWGSSESWWIFAKLLEKEGYHVIIPDLPGFWKTEIHEVFTLEKYAEIIEELVSWLGLKKIILWWHSNGWAITTLIVSRNNIKIQKTVLNNSAGIRNDRKRWLKRKVLGLLSFLKHVPWYEKLRPYFHRVIGAHDYARVENNKYLLPTYYNMIESDLQEIFPHITNDILLIWWENDSYTPLSDGKKIHELLPNSDLITLTWQKHGIHHHAPEILRDTFLKHI